MEERLSNYTNLQVLGIKNFRLQRYGMAEEGLENCIEEGDGDLQIASQDFKKLEETQIKVPASIHTHYSPLWLAKCMNSVGWFCGGGSCWEGQVFSSWFQRGVYQRSDLRSALGDAQGKNKVIF